MEIKRIPKVVMLSCIWCMNAYTLKSMQTIRQDHRACKLCVGHILKPIGMWELELKCVCVCSWSVCIQEGWQKHCSGSFCSTCCTVAVQATEGEGEDVLSARQTWALWHSFCMCCCCWCCSHTLTLMCFR